MPRSAATTTGPTVDSTTVDYTPGTLMEPDGRFCRVTSLNDVTAPILAVPKGIVLWLHAGGAGTTGVAIPWRDVLRMAVHAAKHNSAARADLLEALQVPDEATVVTKLVNSFAAGARTGRGVP